MQIRGALLNNRSTKYSTRKIQEHDKKVIDLFKKKNDLLNYFLIRYVELTTHYRKVS
jgi:hypothetical protein